MSHESAPKSEAGSKSACGPTSETVASNLPALNWIVQHAEQSPVILADLEQIVSGASISDKWTAFKSLGDLVVADIASFPFDVPATPDRAALQAFANHPVVKANGTIINLVLQNLPQIIAALQSILSLFNKPTS